MNRSWVNKRGLDLSKELLWISVGQRAAELPAIKAGGLKKNSIDGPGVGEAGPNLVDLQNFFDLQLWQLVVLLPFDQQRPIGFSRIKSMTPLRFISTQNTYILYNTYSITRRSWVKGHTVWWEGIWP